jgi:GGDEF domain-containing protein
VSCVAAIAILGPSGILASLIFMPLLTLLIGLPSGRQLDVAEIDPKDKRDLIIGCLSRFLGEICHPTVAMIVEIDDYQQLEKVYGRGSLESALTFTQSVIEEYLTEADVTIHLDGSRFMSAFASQAPYEPDAMLTTCTRIQYALENVRFITCLPVQLTASMGVATSNKPERPTTEGLTQASFSTLAEASHKAPSAVRAFSEALLSRQAARKNRQQRETMIKKALQALTFWDKAGLTAPRICVNF